VRQIAAEIELSCPTKIQNLKAQGIRVETWLKVTDSKKPTVSQSHLGAHLPKGRQKKPEHGVEGNGTRETRTNDVRQDTGGKG